MNGRETTIGINLATRPFRNRRLFLLLRSSFVAAMVLFGALLVLGAVRYGIPALRMRSALSGQKAVLAGLQTDLRKATADVKKKETSLGQTIKEVNEVIFRKSFSWTGLLTEVEKALPDSCRLAAFSPGACDGRSVPLKLKVVSEGLPDLMRFIEELNDRGFRDIRTTGEQKGDGRGIVTDMSLTYERHE